MNQAHKERQGPYGPSNWPANQHHGLNHTWKGHHIPVAISPRPSYASSTLVSARSSTPYISTLWPESSFATSIQSLTEEPQPFSSYAASTASEIWSTISAGRERTGLEPSFSTSIQSPTGASQSSFYISSAASTSPPFSFSITGTSLVIATSLGTESLGSFSGTETSISSSSTGLPNPYHTSVGVIVGSVLGSLGSVGLLLFCLFWLHKRNGKLQTRYEDEEKSMGRKDIRTPGLHIEHVRRNSDPELDSALWSDSRDSTTRSSMASKSIASLSLLSTNPSFSPNNALPPSPEMIGPELEDDDEATVVSSRPHSSLYDMVWEGQGTRYVQRLRKFISDEYMNRRSPDSMRS